MIHVYPLNDLEEHDTGESTVCKCNPFVECNDELLVVHNSFDGREAVERANAILGGLPEKKWEALLFYDERT